MSLEYNFHYESFGFVHETFVLISWFPKKPNYNPITKKYTNQKLKHWNQWLGSNGFDLLLLLLIFTSAASIRGMQIPWLISALCCRRRQTSRQVAFIGIRILSPPLIALRKCFDPLSCCLNPINFPRDTLLSWKNDAEDWPNQSNKNKNISNQIR